MLETQLNVRPKSEKCIVEGSAFIGQQSGSVAAACILRPKICVRRKPRLCFVSFDNRPTVVSSHKNWQEQRMRSEKHTFFCLSVSSRCSARDVDTFGTDRPICATCVIDYLLWRKLMRIPFLFPGALVGESFPYLSATVVGSVFPLYAVGWYRFCFCQNALSSSWACSVTRNKGCSLRHRCAANWMFHSLSWHLFPCLYVLSGNVVFPESLSWTFWLNRKVLSPRSWENSGRKERAWRGHWAFVLFRHGLTVGPQPGFGKKNPALQKPFILNYWVINHIRSMEFSSRSGGAAVLWVG